MKACDTRPSSKQTLSLRVFNDDRLINYVETNFPPSLGSPPYLSHLELAGAELTMGISRVRLFRRKCKIFRNANERSRSELASLHWRTESRQKRGRKLVN